MTTMVVTDQTRSAAFELLTDLEWNLRYYTAKADQLQRMAYWSRFSVLSGVLAEAFLAYPLSQIAWGWMVIVVLGVLLAILAIWDALSNHARDSGILKLTALVCDELRTEANRLWRDVESGRVGTDEAESRIESIYHRWEKATDKVLSAFDNRLSERCEKDAIEMVRGRYDHT